MGVRCYVACQDSAWSKGCIGCSEVTVVGYEDREYMRDTPDYRLSFGVGWTDTVKLLMAISITVFLVHAILKGQAKVTALSDWTELSFAKAVQHGQLWRFVTYQFMHAGVWHILLNMLALYALGPLVEKEVGTKPFLTVYLLGGVAGGAVVMVLAALFPQYRTMPDGNPWGLVGASACLCALIIPAFDASPGIRLLFLRKATFLWLFITISGAFTLATIIKPELRWDGIAHEAHLGGLAFGWLWARYRFRVSRATAGMRRGRWLEKRQRELAELEREEQEVDRILAKVHDHGMTSLTRKEKKTLQRATERQRQEDQRISRL